MSNDIISEAKFEDFALNSNILRAVQDMGYIKATPIQAQAIPTALKGRDVLGCAMTGSGKTAAFVLPILQRLIDKPRGKTRALILTPTRELAAQIHEQLELLGKYSGVTSAAVFGGMPMKPQMRAFMAGVDVIVATPGRLLDHFNNEYAALRSLEMLVLDEADRMLDMGFLPDIKRVLKHIPKAEQTLFFSATMPGPIAHLSRELLKNPLTINATRKAAPASGIVQAAYAVSQELKSPLLLALLQQNVIGNVIVFTRTKHRANRLADYLIKNGFEAERIHGNRSQAQRMAALAAFKSGQCRVMVATDIAARGIDVEALEHVVNFDVPNVPEDYIHRVGRTARAERTGEAFTFISPDEEGNLRDIESAIQKRLPRVTLDGFNYSAKPAERLEIPIAERIAAIRAQKSLARAKTANKTNNHHQKTAQSNNNQSGKHQSNPGASAARAATQRRSGEPSITHTASNVTHTTTSEAERQRRTRRRRGGYRSSGTQSE